MSARNSKTVKELVLQGNYGYGWDDLTYYEDTPEGRAERKADYQAYKENEPGVAFRTIERRVPNKNYVAPDVDSSCTKKSVKASEDYTALDMIFTGDAEAIAEIKDACLRIGGTVTNNSKESITFHTFLGDSYIPDLKSYAKELGLKFKVVSPVNSSYTKKSVKSNKINKRRAIKASDFEFIMDEPEDDGSLAGYYSWDDLTDDQRDYVISHWGDFRSFADSMYEWFNDYIMDVYYEDKEMLADEYNEKYGFNIDTDKISWSSNSQGPYPDHWDNEKIFGKVWLATAGNLSDVDVSFGGSYDVDTYADYYVGVGDDEHIEYGVGVDELAEYGANEEAISIIRNLADGAQEFIDKVWKLINYTCTAYPDDEWVAETLDANPNSFTFIVDDNGDVEDIT